MNNLSACPVNCRLRFLVLAALLLQFVTVSVLTGEGRAAEPPEIDELVQAHTELRAAVARVEGEFRIYRSEAVEPRAMEVAPAELGLPLKLSGVLWRDEGTFRADYTAYRQANGTTETLQHAIGVDDEAAYDFSEGKSLHGMLQSCEKGTPEADGIIRSVQLQFLRYVDALWSIGSGTPVVDLLQRPDSRLVPDIRKGVMTGYSINVATGQGTEAVFTLNKAMPYPLKYSRGGPRDDLSFSVERKMFMTTNGKVKRPKRVVEVSRMGAANEGYTEVAVLELEPLARESPIANGITSASFRDIGIPYQEYTYEKNDGQQLGRKYNDVGPRFPAHREKDWRRGILIWAGGFFIAAVLIYACYSRYRSNRDV